MENKSDINYIIELFDVSFSRFISVDIIRILYIVSVILAAAVVLVGVIAAFTNSISAGIGSIILAPIVFVAYVLFVRVIFEVFIVIFRIAENTEKITEILSED